MRKQSVIGSAKDRILILGRHAAIAALAVAAVLAVAMPSVQAQTFSVLYTFTGNPDGGNPEAKLVRDSAGNLYSTTSSGGADNAGMVFKLNPTGIETVLYSFESSGADGGTPEGDLVLDSAGNLYGTTLSYDGNLCGCGTVFRLTPTGKEAVVYTFGDGVDGAYPEGGLVTDSAGNLYGTASSGGAYDNGTVFRISKAGHKTVLYNFEGGTDAASPQSDLVLDSVGNLYGTSYLGGAYDAGTVFRVSQTGAEVVLYSFTGGTDGGNPVAGLVRDSAGNLYGTTPYGGQSCSASGSGCGVVFKLAPSGKETVLYSFTGGPDGGFPGAPLIRDTSGNLYGTTYNGGNASCTPYGCGTVFALAANGKERVLYSFTGGTDGWGPSAALVRDVAGNLYGTAAFGGDLSVCDGGCGVVFEINAAGAPPKSAP